MKSTFILLIDYHCTHNCEETIQGKDIDGVPHLLEEIWKISGRAGEFEMMKFTGKLKAQYWIYQ
ncbi:MAG: hypothetical protein IPK55_12160 [Streptococcus sp.]|nr:hypothetical protein [Streptococcus sp.]